MAKVTVDAQDKGATDPKKGGAAPRPKEGLYDFSTEVLEATGTVGGSIGDI